MSVQILPDRSFGRIELPGGGYMTRAHYEQIPFAKIDECRTGEEGYDVTPLGYVRDEERHALFIDLDGELSYCTFSDISCHLGDVGSWPGRPPSDAPEEHWRAFQVEREKTEVAMLRVRFITCGQIYLD